MYLNTHALARAHTGPVLHFWFGLLNRLGNIPILANKSTPKSAVVFAKMIVDQTVGSVVWLSGFFVFFEVTAAACAGTIAMEGVPAVLRRGVEKVSSLLWPTLVVSVIGFYFRTSPLDLFNPVRQYNPQANWKLWPIVQIFTFAAIPLRYQVDPHELACFSSSSREATSFASPHIPSPGFVYKPRCRGLDCLPFRFHEGMNKYEELISRTV